MKFKSFTVSTEVLAGLVLVILGLLMLASGRHDMISQALTPFGIGLILMDVLIKAGKAAREGVEILIRHDDH